MYNKFQLKYIILILVSILVFSCEEYLDKTIEAEVTEEDVFTTFFNYQGYVETGYAQIIDRGFNPWEAPYFNWGDDVVHASRNRLLQEGDYWPVVNGQTRECVYRNMPQFNIYVAGQAISQGRGVWDNSWHGIRIANIALEHLDDLVDATPEERAVLEGQSLFFRGYFHWEIMKQWGGIPYIDQALKPADEMKLPALNFHEAADKVILDLRNASELLPVDWDDHPAGQRTLGNNRGRLTKGIALAVLTEVQLYSGSPLMNGAATGTYDYNHEYLTNAANTAWEVLQLANQGVYSLEPFETYGNLFKSVGQANQEPGVSKENIFRPPYYGMYSKYHVDQWVPRRVGGRSHFESPSQNLIEKFETINGLPIDDPESGFDPANPWENLDPRFYYNIYKDGDPISISMPLNAEMYTGGSERRAGQSVTGYGMKKYIHVTWNNFDGGWNGGMGFHTVPLIRLAEIYLFYAEAVNEVYGPHGTAPGADLTAVDAVNIIRNRAGMPDVHSKFTGSKEAFRERIRNERAVELAFESKRRDDLRRWYVAHETRHKELYGLDFPRDHSFFEKRVVKTIVFDLKHYWFPFPTDQVLLYEGWNQNPGW